MHIYICTHTGIYIHIFTQINDKEMFPTINLLQFISYSVAKLEKNNSYCKPTNETTEKKKNHTDRQEEKNSKKNKNVKKNEMGLSKNGKVFLGTTAIIPKPKLFN